MNKYNREIYCVRKVYSSNRCARAPLVSPPAHPESIHYPESLSSYIARASNYLSFTKSELIENFVLPRTSLQYSLRFLDSGRDSYSVNSVGNVASEFESATKALFSKFTHHEFSTYAFLQPLLGVKAKGLVSKHLKWCPICLNEWRRNKLDLLLPLYWLANDSSACLKHTVSLVGQCPSCSEEPNTITSLSIQGYCDHCGEWLGKASPSKVSIDEASFWKTHAINQLILHKHLLEKENLLANFREFISRTTELNGCARNVEKILGLSDSLIVRWRKRNRPKFSQLLDLSEKLGIFPHEILLGNLRAIDLQSIENSYQCSSTSKKHAPLSLLNLDHQLVNLLESTPGISLKKLSYSLNVSEGFIRYRYPDIADELSNQSSERKETDYAERRRELYEAAIKILCITYQANKSIGIHQLRELLRDYPGFGYLSMPAIREFILNNSFNDEMRNIMGLFSTCNHEKLLLNLTFPLKASCDLPIITRSRLLEV